MSSSVWSKAFVAGCGLSVAIAAGACGGDEAVEVDRDTDRMAADTTAARGHEGAPITLTGCLQKGSGMNNFILTQVNEPSESPVATAGKDANGTAVQREQMREAKHSYVLEGDDDAMEDLVGRQVRVTGKLAETSELHREARTDRTAGERRGLDIDAGDLAKVEVESVTQVAAACGTAAK